MPSYNKVILLGNLTRDPETRSTAGGSTICKLGLAVSRKYTDGQGNQQEETTFVDVDAFGKRAEVLAKYMRKGRPLMVEGRLKLDQWQADDGSNRQKLGVVLENFQFISSGAREGDGRGNASGAGAAADQPSGEDPLDEDVPF